ncbi:MULTISPECIES: TolB family protein [Streptomyces]|uniref:TolB n=1 Tax=Streptomyces viridochromogenes TaxID=1938 RepID=A0A0L8JF07_STRVR|nr:MULTISPECIES: PD40 domain-containing protein [Streptomyces]KOG12235.1 TolB [Streptomyces viridochromogenes]
MNAPTGARLSARARVGILVLALLLLGGGATAYTLRAASGQQAAAGTADAGFTLDGGTALYVRDTASGRVARVDPSAPGGRVVGGPSCDRFHAAGPTALCLQRRPGVPARSYALVLDRNLRELRRIALPGIPSRARVSASGQMLSWTMFATGDSYARSSFSTRTSILDLRTGYLVKNIEQIPLTLGGRRHHAPDVNYWGVTFAADDNRFYATVSTGGRTHLVEGDMRSWSARALRENTECPSLSPDGTRIAFKKRVSDGPREPWRLYVYDLRSGREHPVAERRGIDDQALWTDGRTLAYGYGGAVWSVPADGSGAPRRLVSGASSPAAPR